jgi:PilZ domain
MSDRRRAPRQPIELFFNKYLDGHPYLCFSLDLSPDGVLARTFVEPRANETAFPVEIRLPEDERSLWVRARGVWRRGALQALEFFDIEPEQRARLDRFLGELV